MADAIVIGAGVNGLAAAAHLAVRGWQVEVYESADQPGGARYQNALQQQPPPLATCGTAPASGKSVPQSG